MINKHGKRQSSGHNNTENCVLVLEKSDFDKIEAQLLKRQDDAEKALRSIKEKERLHELSMEQVKNWKNTLYGQRNKRLEARKDRETIEEEKRKNIDVEEALYQAEQRKIAIEKARLQQYYQTDRVKSFHSALILTETMKERDAQVELKQRKQQRDSEKDCQWLDQMRAEDQAWHAQVEREVAERREKNKETVNFQQTQIKCKLDLMEAESRKMRDAAEELRRQVDGFTEERRRLEEARRQAAENWRMENSKHLEQSKAIQEMERLKTEMEDDKARAFAQSKQKMMRSRIEREKEFLQEKQDYLDRLKNKLGSKLLQQQDDEDERIRKAVEEKENRRIREERDKELKRKQGYMESQKHRDEQENLRREQREKQRRSDDDMFQKQLELDAAAATADQQKQIQRAKDARVLSNLHLQQAEERQRSNLKLKEADLQRDKLAREQIDEEERHFQKYASAVIADRERRGRNTQPLRKAASSNVGNGVGASLPGRGALRPTIKS